MDSQAHSYLSGPTTPPLLEETIGQCLNRIAKQYPQRDALVVRHQDIAWTYQEYLLEIDRLATGLLKLGVKPGDRIGIWSPNRVEWCLTQYATAKIGAIMVCINPAYRLHELEYALKQVECTVLISAEQFKSSDYLEMLDQLIPELKQATAGKLQAANLPQLTTVIRMGQGKTPGMFNFDKVCDEGGVAEYLRLRELNKALNPHDAINKQFTSGTTGSPKGATLTHHNILNNGNQVALGMNLCEQDRVCIPVPLYHCFGMVMGNLACLTQGAAAILPSEAFDPETVLETVEAERCTALHGVPTMFIAELETPNFDEFDLSSLRTGIMAGSPCPADVMRNVISRMHMREVTIMYGQTETSPVNHMTARNDPLDKRCETVGKIGPHQEVKIVDADGNTVATGEKGELCCRGYSVMKGYWGEEAQTGCAIDEEQWMHSGDLAIMDAEGYVQIVGRIKDMIIRGGENIYPREIEEFLYTHPAIQEAQVFGIADEKFGEAVCAWIKLKKGTRPTEEDILAFCKERIAHFKVPTLIRFVDEFPMTVTGKIQKFRMREHMQMSLKENINA